MINSKGTVFPVTTLSLAGTTEEVVVGGRDKFGLLPVAFEGIKTIGVIGWGSQGPAQAQNLRDSLEGTNIRVKVGLQIGSSSFAKAEVAGFSVADGTLGEMYDVIGESDLVILLISDAAQAENYERILATMEPGATLGLSHGFLLGHMKNVGAKFRPDINVIMVAPKGMGPSVRRLYEQGKDGNGAGINASYAVEQEVTDNARNIALGWAVAIGSPYVFPTTLEMEYRSDIFGERGVLLGAIWGSTEALNTHFITEQSGTRAEAFMRSAMSLTGPISKAISQGGLLEVANRAREGRFYETMGATYKAAKLLLAEIYDEVASGREIGSVVDATKRLKGGSMSKVDGAPMWRTGERVRADNPEVALDPTTAGVYIGIMMAQVDLLKERGHGWSEICNESIIEAVDSLNPYMAKRGVDYMVDNCSTTARLGTRKWGPRFNQMVTSEVLPNVQGWTDDTEKWFKEHVIHGALAETMKLRPPVDIAV